METMDGPSLFESMYSDDAEGQRMKEMPGVDELMMIYPLKTISFSIYCQTLLQVLSAGVLCTLQVAGRRPTSNHI